MPRRLDDLLSGNTRLCSAEEIAFASRCAERASTLPLAVLVACHGDYNRHNWLVDRAGILRVIDFGEAARHRAAFDFTKLFYGAWWSRPNLAAVFFEGYGRRQRQTSWSSANVGWR